MSRLGKTNGVKLSNRVCGGSLSALLLAASGSAHGSPVLPSGGTVTAGSATISSPNLSSLQISQSSGKAIITWSQFSIGQGGAVQFNNGSGATLNRVVGGGPISSIDGLLTATGSIYLINPNGVIIGKSGQVNVGGTFVASTLDIPDDSFMAGGDLTFSGSSAATVINLGSIGAFGGDVVLMAQIVRNEGSIAAPGGDIGLLAGTTVLLRDVATDDGKFAVQVGGPGSLASNTGAISAAMAELRANGGNVYALAGDTTGVINATGVSTNDGKVFLVADGGEVTAHGMISATASDGSGGSVQMTGGAVNITGVQVAAANWLVQADSLDITPAAANSLSANLANTNITLATTGASGTGDITIDGRIAWSSANSLTLNAFGDITVNKGVTLGDGALTLSAPTGVATVNSPIQVRGSGSVDLEASDFGFGLTGDGFAGQLSFLGRGAYTQALTINGQPYTLIYNLLSTEPNSLGGIDSNAAAGGDAGYYALADDLGSKSRDQSTTTLVGVGANTFTGVFEGLGHDILNLDISVMRNNAVGPNYSEAYGGVFGTNSGTIRDIGVVGGSVTGFISLLRDPGTVIGGLVGFNVANGAPASIINAFTTNTVSGGDAVGGLVGFNQSDLGDTGAPSLGGVALVENSHSTGAVNTDGPDAGGLVGENYGFSFNASTVASAVIKNSYATGAVSGFQGDTGGLVGSNESVASAGLGTAKIINSYSTGSVSNTSNGSVGGLVGNSITYGGVSVIANSYATGTVTGGINAGGLVGSVTSDTYGNNTNSGLVAVTNSYATGSVVGFNTQGGLIGSLSTPATYGGYYGIASVSDTYATGSISGGNLQGGLIGSVSGGTITASYSTGSVTGVGTQGGLVGSFGLPPPAESGDPAGTATIVDTYAIGAVSGGTTQGGLIGLIDGGSISTSYWDKTTTGLTKDGQRESGKDGAKGLTDTQLLHGGAHFSGTDFAGGKDGVYPYLVSLPPS